jgi:predicted Zn-dependent peptidase
LGLIYSVDASMENYDDTGCFSIAFLTAPENLPAALEATLNELELLIRQGVSQQELDRGRRLFMAELEYSKDSTSAMCSRFGMGTLLGVARSADEDQQRLKAVTLEDLQRLASQLFRSDNCFLVAVGPLAEVDQQQIRGQLQGWGMESVKQVCTCPD